MNEASHTIAWEVSQVQPGGRYLGHGEGWKCLGKSVETAGKEGQIGAIFQPGRRGIAEVMVREERGEVGFRGRSPGPSRERSKEGAATEVSTMKPGPGGRGRGEKACDGPNDGQERISDDTKFRPHVEEGKRVDEGISRMEGRL